MVHFTTRSNPDREVLTVGRMVNDKLEGRGRGNRGTTLLFGGTEKNHEKTSDRVDSIPAHIRTDRVSSSGPELTAIRFFSVCFCLRKSAVCCELPARLSQP
jgi:hypothetical protein